MYVQLVNYLQLHYTWFSQLISQLVAIKARKIKYNFKYIHATDLLVMVREKMNSKPFTWTVFKSIFDFHYFKITRVYF